MSEKHIVTTVWNRNVCQPTQPTRQEVDNVYHCNTCIVNLNSNLES